MKGFIDSIDGLLLYQFLIDKVSPVYRNVKSLNFDLEYQFLIDKVSPILLLPTVAETVTYQFLIDKVSHGTMTKFELKKSLLLGINFS